MNQYLHQLPGRVRIRSPRLKGNPAAAEDVRRLFGEVSGIREAAANPLTGSILVVFDPRLTSAESVLNRLSAAGFFDPARAVGCDHYLQEAAMRAGEKVGKVILQAALERCFQGTPLGLLTALI